MGKKRKLKSYEPKVTDLQIMHLNKGPDMQNF